jgi:hypothetical protein
MLTAVIRYAQQKDSEVIDRDKKQLVRRESTS